MSSRRPRGGTHAVAPSARRTATSRFGASRREGHDASAFYDRFTPPIISLDDKIGRGPGFDQPLLERLGDGCFSGDARRMAEVPDASVALVVTSPPYFVGKSYEDAFAAGADSRIPTSYFDYLDMLRDVFAECVRALEPGGRIAVNVANLGRKPYRSLSGDVARIFEDLGLLLRGEIVWQKSKGSSGSCAWGSFRSPSNPTLRDTTERIVIASKGRFDRARSAAQRRAESLPHRSSLSTDEFMEATLDVWDMGPESAQRVRHPAPFPLELPRRLIDLYTYEDDLVLDPFMGSGTTLVASVLCGRWPVGYDLNPDYVELARSRVAHARLSWRRRQRPVTQPPLFDRAQASPVASDAITADAFAPQAVGSGRKVHDIAADLLTRQGFDILRGPVKLRGSGVQFSFLAQGRSGEEWWVEVAGACTTVRPGLLRAETLWKTLGRASVLIAAEPDARLLVLTPHLPRPGSESDRALRTLGPAAIFDVVELFDDAAADRLAGYSEGAVTPLAGFWDDDEIDTAL